MMAVQTIGEFCHTLADHRRAVIDSEPHELNPTVGERHYVCGDLASQKVECLSGALPLWVDQ